ncbi:hypothetical protein [Nocardia sp. NBC_01009]|uniref:hypothetical protein n=1 Tax=Nocardia sp. NBC_01009 TaxID=2975996 RepID=UPI00386A4777|nr:hypothetical protein OHA42_17595 [Nocardia sp. NBC_01009]
MTNTNAARENLWSAAGGTDSQLPQDDTLVLLNRELRPGTDPARLSRFGDDRWHLNEAIFEAAAQATSLPFASIPVTLRLIAKHYVWQLINTDCPVPLNRASHQGWLA